MSFKPTKYLPYDFANRRHIGPSPSEITEMLDLVGYTSLNDFIDDTIPKNIRQKNHLILEKQSLSGSYYFTWVKLLRKIKS